MSLQLPSAPATYSKEDQASVRLLLQNEDRKNLKTEGDVVITGGLRVVLVAPNGTRYALGVSNAGALTATAL